MTPYPPSDSPGDPLHLYGKGRTLTIRGWLLVSLALGLLVGGAVLAKYLQVRAEPATQTTKADR